MNIVIVCRIIDNFGDAGFSLRLALEICKRNHSVKLLCDDIQILLQLAPPELPSNLKLLEVQQGDKLGDQLCETNAVIECFGSSSCPASALSNPIIQSCVGQVPWLVVDYLSAESWIEEFHGVKSINPQTGYESTYFYPGFSNKTGGVIHSDCLPFETVKKPEKRKKQKIFVFCYPQAPLDRLASALMNHQQLVVSEKCVTTKIKRVETTPFCPITEFDQLLMHSDWCFVRGEDSFVRAQLIGKPFVWQIYPTMDRAHEGKLASFFEIYTETLAREAKAALKDLWWAWNGLNENINFEATWSHVDQHYCALEQHANEWALKLRNGPDLVSEILTTIQDSPLFRPI